VTDSRPAVLIVEDNAITRAGLAAVLGQHGYAVTTAPNGRVGLDLLSGGLVPAVILLDMLMPDVDGWHFLDAHNATPRRAGPVIVMSGVGLSGEWAADNGCFDFLRKPFDERDLFDVIRRAVAAPARRANHFPDASLN
jgi:CheY-like chemotaxis protein